MRCPVCKDLKYISYISDDIEVPGLSVPCPSCNYDDGIEDFLDADLDICDNWEDYEDT